MTAIQRVRRGIIIPLDGDATMRWGQQPHSTSPFSELVVALRNNLWPLKQHPCGFRFAQILSPLLLLYDTFNLLWEVSALRGTIIYVQPSSFGNY